MSSADAACGRADDERGRAPETAQEHAGHDGGFGDEEESAKAAEASARGGPEQDWPVQPGNRVLLHSCCAPCSGAMFEEMMSKELDVTIFFYNPNIHPRKEYEIRKEENKRYARKHDVPFVDCDYDAERWFERMKGLEYEPERGTRCTECFDMRMEVTALYAYEHGFDFFTTTNATSRWKDVNQVNGSGVRAAAWVNNKFFGAEAGQPDPAKKRVHFWEYNWQTDAMTRRKYEISAEERFYKQEYCGCSYSLRDSNLWRKQNGIPPVMIGGDRAGLGTRYFEDPDVDAEEESQEVVDAFFKDASNQFGDEGLRENIDKNLAVFEGRKKAAPGAVVAPCNGKECPRKEELQELNNW